MIGHMMFWQYAMDAPTKQKSVQPKRRVSKEFRAVAMMLLAIVLMSFATYTLTAEKHNNVPNNLIQLNKI